MSHTTYFYESIVLSFFVFATSAFLLSVFFYISHKKADNSFVLTLFYIYRLKFLINCWSLFRFLISSFIMSHSFSTCFIKINSSGVINESKAIEIKISMVLTLKKLSHLKMFFSGEGFIWHFTPPYILISRKLI